MAQRKRAGLITPRTLDRNELPVFITLQLLYRSSISPFSSVGLEHQPSKMGVVGSSPTRGGRVFIAQLVERTAVNREVTGSNPVWSEKNFIVYINSKTYINFYIVCKKLLIISVKK